MTRLTTSFPVLVALATSLGCGDGEAGPIRETGHPTAGEGQGGAGGQAAGLAEGGQWVYETDEEGVFPKDRVLDIKVAMPEEAWTRLIATAIEEVWSTADVTIDGQSLGEVGFRPKGAYSLDTCVDDRGRLVCDKLSFKLKFDKVDPDGRFYGLKRLVLNQIVDAWGLYGESLAYQIYNDFGITAPRTSFAILTVNGESFGIYRVVEVVDGRFTAHHFEDRDGNLYKEAWPVSTDEAYFAGALRTNEETGSNETFIAFSADMLAATDNGLPQSLAKYTDLDRMLDYMAVDYAITNWDGITTFYAGDWGQANHNYYMYQSVDSATFTLIPWDLNAVFLLDHWLGDIDPWDTLRVDCNAPIPTADGDLATIPAACDPTIRAIALSKDRYHASVRRLLDEVFVEDRLCAKIDDYVRQIAPAMENDPFVSYLEMAGAAEYLKNNLPAFRSRLEAVLTGGEGGAGHGGAGNPGAEPLPGTGGAGNGGASNGGAGNGGAGNGGTARAMLSALAELLCAASAELECYNENACVNEFETELVTPLARTCPEATLQRYADCIVVEDRPTVCANGALMPNLGVCLTELQAVLACADPASTSAD
ncbi:MAG: CotH kinase family protein [Polyangiaceae bacterium]|nr:CotH kinase family protein [Polyangiaceae bacterium]